MWVRRDRKNIPKGAIAHKKGGINTPYTCGFLAVAKGICDTQLDFVNKNSTSRDSKRKRQYK